MACVNVSHPDFTNLLARVTLNSFELEMIVKQYQEDNGPDAWPSPEEVMDARDSIRRKKEPTAAEYYGPKGLNQDLLTDPLKAYQFFTSILNRRDLNANGFFSVPISKFSDTELRFLGAYGFQVFDTKKGDSSYLVHNGRKFSLGEFPISSRMAIFRTPTPLYSLHSGPKLDGRTEAKLRRTLTDFMKANNIQIESLEGMLTRLQKRGVITSRVAGIAGIADVMNKVVAVADGTSAKVLGEEVGHIVLGVLGPEHQMVRPLLSAIEELPYFQDLYNEYYEVYKETQNLTPEEADLHTRMEIAGKALVDQLVELSEAPTLQTRVGRLLSYVWNAIKKLFTTPSARALQNEVKDILGPLATNILEGQPILEGKRSKDPNSIFYNLDTTRLDKIVELIDKEYSIRVSRAKRSVRSDYGDIAEAEALIDENFEIKEEFGKDEYAAGVMKYLQRLDDHIQDYLDKMTKPGFTYAQSADWIQNTKDFVRRNKTIAARTGEYINSLSEEDGYDLEDREILETALINALGRLAKLESYANQNADLALNAMMLEAMPGEYEDGDIHRAYSEDVGFLRNWLGSLRTAPNVMLRAATKLFAEISNERRHRELEVADNLVDLEQEFLKTHKVQDLWEKDSNGEYTGDIIHEFNHRELGRMFDEVKYDMVQKFGKSDYDGVIDYVKMLKDPNHVNTKEEAADLKYYNKTWRTFMNSIYDYSDYEQMARELVVQKRGKETEIVNILDRVNKLPLEGRLTIKQKNTKYVEGQKLNFKNEKGFNVRVFVRVENVTEDGFTIVKIDPTDEGLNRKNSRIVNPEYNRVKDMPFYKAYVDELMKSKKDLSVQYRIGDHKWRMPQIYASGEELLKDGRVKSLKEAVKMSFIRNSDDALYGTSILGINGDVINFVPVYYTSPLDHPHLMSRHMVSSLSRFAGMARKHNVASKKEAQLLMMLEQVEGSTFQTSKHKAVPGLSSNVYSMLNDAINVHIYGQSQKAVGGEVDEDAAWYQKVAWDKVAKTTATWIASSNLAFSIPIGISNFVKGSVDQLVERIYGTLIDTDSYGYALAEANRNLPGILADINSPKKHNKIAALLRYTDIAFHNSLKELDTRNKLSRTQISDLAYSTFTIPDLERKAKLLVSVMDNLRYIDGTLYDKDSFMAGKSDRKAAQKTWSDARKDSLYNRVEMVNGNISGISKQDLFYVKNILRDLSPRLEGTIDELDQSRLSREVWGRFLLMHRSWLVGGTEFRAHGQVIDPLTGKPKEGYYRTGAKMFANLFKMAGQDGRYLDLASEYFSSLSSMQKKNLVRLGVDASFFVLFMTIAALVNAAAEDDDDDPWWLEYAAWQMSRIYLEQGAFFNPFEVTTIIESPTAGVHHIKDIMQIPGVILGGNDVVSSGPYKDKTKLERLAWKRLWLKNLYEMQYPKEKNRWLRSSVLKQGFWYEALEESFTEKDEDKK